MSPPEKAQKKYCLNCFRIMEAEQMLCENCQYLQPSKYNPTYIRPPYRIQQYILGRVLGHGGFAITYLAYDRSLGTRVAIKEYFPAEFANRAPDGENVIPYEGERETLFQLGKDKFIAEARLLATLRNPNIIRIRQFIENANTAYFIMEYLEGNTLKEYIMKKGGQLSWEETKALLLPILGALEEVHSKQCYHRDIKPENIYISQNKTPILLDFGAARQHMSGATTNLLAFVTPGFAPAEQYSSNGIQGPWTDIYSLAATMYYALMGETPPVPQDRAMGECELIRPSEKGIDIPPREEEWLLKGLEVKWSSRPETVSHWRMMLERNFTQTVELKAEELQKEMGMAFLRSAILPRLTLRLLTPEHEQEVHEAAKFIGLNTEQVNELIEQALLMTGSDRRAAIKTESAPLHKLPETPTADASSRERIVKQRMEAPKSQSPSSNAQRSNVQAEDSNALAPRIRNSLGMEFVLVKPFLLNKTGKAEFITFNLGTEHRPYNVQLTRPYYLQTTQITQGQWRVVMGNNPAQFQGDDWQPVEQISWDDIASFTQRLNMLNEGFYRLPTEAEWFFACSGEDFDDRYSFGNDENRLQDFAWYDANAQGRPHAVGLKRPNRFGLYDMHGNVWEWIADRFGAFPIGDFENPKGPDRGNSRVMRGGSWNLGANYCTVKSRNYESASYKASNLGVRLLLEPK